MQGDVDLVLFEHFADSPRDSVQFIEWSPTSCPRALLIANFHGRITIWTQPSQVSYTWWIDFNFNFFNFCFYFQIFTYKILPLTSF